MLPVSSADGITIYPYYFSNHKTTSNAYCCSRKWTLNLSETPGDGINVHRRVVMDEEVGSLCEYTSRIGSWTFVGGYSYELIGDLLGELFERGGVQD